MKSYRKQKIIALMFGRTNLANRFKISFFWVLYACLLLKSFLNTQQRKTKNYEMNWTIEVFCLFLEFFAIKDGGYAYSSTEFDNLWRNILKL